MKSEHPETADHARLALTTDAPATRAQYPEGMPDIKVRAPEPEPLDWLDERRSLVGTPPPKALATANAFIDQFWPEPNAS